MTLPAARPKICRCKICGESYIKHSMSQVVCSIPCSVKHAQNIRDKADRAEFKIRKERIKPRNDWLREAQQAFNAYIRTRDATRPCICCGKPLGEGDVGGKYDCGHYRSIGSAPHLRFDERNAHAQRKQCNRYGAGRAVDYRIGLIIRIGIEAVEALEADQTTKKWSIDDLKAIKAHYKQKTKELLKEAA